MSETGIEFDPEFYTPPDPESSPAYIGLMWLAGLVALAEQVRGWAGILP